MSLELSPIEEEYLEAIWHLEERNKVARTGDISQRLKVTMGTASNMIDHLEHEGLLEHEHYRGVRLTEKGREAATTVVRRHRLGERLLTDILHLDWSRAHDAACKLEHSLTKEVTDSLDATLGNPKTCPHGNPIPSEDGLIVEYEEEAVALSELQPGDEASVSRVTEEGTEMLQYLATLGMMPGTHVLVEAKAPFSGPLMIKVGGASYALSRDVAALIWVRKD
jgi:DtxR family Mn-dependent transcriptional regulator